MGEYLTKTGVKLLAISETQKYGHVTYFFNGNKQGKFALMEPRTVSGTLQGAYKSLHLIIYSFNTY